MLIDNASTGTERLSEEDDGRERDRDRRRRRRLGVARGMAMAEWTRTVAEVVLDA